jgi:predicted ester cyclase
MLMPCVTKLPDEQRQALAHTIVYPTKTEANGVLKTTVDLWQRRCTRPGASHTEVIAMVDLETDKAIALRLIEVFNGRRLDLLEDVLHPEFRGRGISAFAPDGPEVGPGARRKLYEMFLQAIPDARGEVLNVVAEGDKVVLLDRFGGTHRGEFLGRPGTGNHIEWMAIHFYTMRDGKVLEDAYMRDELAIMQQLGPAPSLTKAAE